MTNGPGNQRHLSSVEVNVWDRFVRIFHWSLIGLFITAYATKDTYELIHESAGYAVLALVLARIVWGFVGSSHARFRDFFYRPGSVLRFLFDTLRFRAKRYLGHNPAGGAMVVALIFGLLIVCGSGVMMTLDQFWGQKWIEEVHEFATYSTFGLVALHVLGVLLASIEHKENLVNSMFTGRKRLD